MIGSLLLIHGSGHGRDIDLHDLPKFLVFVANVFPETRNQLDPPLWSLHIEVSFDGVLPLIGLALLRAKRPWIVCLSFIAAGLAWTTVGTIHAWPPEATWTLPTYLGAFAAGILAATLSVRPRLAPALVALGTVAVVANAVWHSGGTGELGHAVGDLPAALGFGAVTAGISARPGRLLSSAPLRVLGTLSFGIYLWHMPVLYALQLHDRFPERFLPAVAWVLPFTFLLAIASWYLIEKPAIALSGRALSRPTARQPVPAES